MKWAQLTGLALVVLSAESVLVQSFAFDVTRVDVSVAIVVYAALRCTTVEGALTAFSVGYVLDVFTGKPTGLYAFLAMLVFVVVRGIGQIIDARPRPVFAAFAGAAAFGHAIAAFLLTWLTSRTGEGRAWSLSGLPVQMVLSGLMAWVMFPLLRRIEPGERPQTGIVL